MGLEEDLEKLDKIYKEEKAAIEEKLKLQEASKIKYPRLAEAIHEATCHSNHTDQCDWYYDRGDWTSYSRVRAAKKADQVMDICDDQFLAIKILAVIS